MFSETSLRLAIFISTFSVLALLEVYWPKRVLVVDKWVRWRRNFSLIAIGNICVYLLLPFSAVSAAWVAQNQQLGLLYFVHVPIELRIVLAVLLLDFFIYLQHVAFHHIPWLWRFHQVHHMDQDIDVTSGIRFHPIEILLSIGFKAIVIVAMGAPVTAVIVFELLLNVMALFSHSNLALPKLLDRYVRWLIVTPDMHRVHHSSLQQEERSNFGFNISWWDRLFNTYQAQPSLGHDNMSIGLANYHSPKTTPLIASLVAPFTNNSNVKQS